MKYFLALIFAFNTFLASNQLSATQIEDYLTYDWTGPEDELYLHITLSDGLEFNSIYSIAETQDGQGQICEIIISPREGYSVFSSDGLLQEIKLTAIVKNVENPNLLLYWTFVNSHFDLNKNGKLITVTKEEYQTGTLYTPAIDLSVEPEFFSFDDAPNEGIIVFKNLFPVSQLQQVE